MACRVVFAFALVGLCLASCNGVQGRILTGEDGLKVERELKSQYKSHNQHGDIIDCVDINKQPAFDHPLLNNHKIQMRPSSFPSGINNNAFLGNFQHAEIKSIRCPIGTIPIRRTRNHDAIQFKSSRQHYRANIQALNDPIVSHNAVQTTLRDKDIYYGSKAAINVYGLPEINVKGQLSIAATWIVGEDRTPDMPDTIMVGWAVDPSTYGDNKTHLTTYWHRGSSDTHCIDLLCPGFVQVSSDVHVGAVIQPLSIYSGQQYYISVSIFKDPKTNDWWLMYGDDNKAIGYWPKDLFSSLEHGGSQVQWGGKVNTHWIKLGPPMGSGHFPNEGYGKAAFFKRIQIVDTNNVMKVPNPIQTKSDRPDCYQMGKSQNNGGEEGLNFFYGGPAGCVG